MNSPLKRNGYLRCSNHGILAKLTANALPCAVGGRVSCWLRVSSCARGRRLGRRFRSGEEQVKSTGYAFKKTVTDVNKKV